MFTKHSKVIKIGQQEWTLESGKIARQAADLVPGEELQIQLEEGQVKVLITEVSISESSS